MTIDQFGKALVASGLMTAEDVKAFWAAIPADGRPKDGAAFGKLLVEKSLLTPFQVAELLAGRGARLIMGDYTIVTQIGAGGMGQVYKAQHRRMKRTVALKVMSNAAMQDEAAVKRFQREVHAAAKLEHPNIVTAYDSGESGSVKYLVMQFVDGGDLSDLVKKNGRLGIEQAVGYVIQAAKGLAFAHGEGVIHRDIKPANLLLDKKGIVKILDMGLARFEDGGDGLTATEQVMGTVDYMSPEQAANTKGCDGRADIYSLGCTLWYLLTAKKLYEADTLIARLMLHRDGPLPSLVKERDDAPWPLEQALHKMIAKRAADRYQSMDEVVAAIAPYGGDPSLSGSIGSSGTGGGQSADLASFMQSMGTGGGTKTNVSATQIKPATGTAIDATAQFTSPEVGTDPKSAVMTKGVAPAAATVNKLKPGAKKSKGSNNRTKLIAAGTLGGLLLLAGIIVLIRNKNGEVVAEVKVPEGGSVEVVAQPRPVTANPATVAPLTPSATYDIAALLESPDYIWSAPENLGPAINGPGDQILFSLTNDLHRLYFGRKGADGRTNDVLEVVRSSLTAPFGEPKVIGEASEAFVSGDGLTIVQAGPDISMKRRPTLDSAFGPADRLSQLNTPTSAERRPTLSPDGLTLVFSTDRAPDMKTDLWISRRKSQSESFGPAESIGPPLNTPGYEQFGTLLVDDRTLIFVRTNDNGGWLMTTTNSFGKTVAVPLPNNPFGTTLNLWLAPDGRTAYFSADLPGGFGGNDIYVTRRVPKSGATPAIASTPSFIQSLPTTVPPGVQNLPAGKWGLRFEPGQFVEAGPAPYRDTTVVTTEIWLTDESDPTLNQSVLVGGPNGYIHISNNDSLTMYTPHRGNPEPVAMPKNQRVHIAAVNDGRGRRLYVNGKLAASSDDAGSPTSGNRDKSLPIEIGNKHRFRGVIDGVRISTTARYTADFTPDQTFTADKDTFAVYRFDEGQGNVLKDSSANGYHGRIDGANWVRGASTATAAEMPPPPGDYALQFVQYKRAEAPNPQLDESQPFTVEAYITPGDADPNRLVGQRLFGVDSEFHFEIKDNRWRFYSTHNDATSPDRFTPRRRVHVAGVRTTTGRQLFLDGKLVASMNEPLNQKSKDSEAPLLFEARGGVECTLDEIRISQGIVYDKEFAPPAKLTADANTLALYHFDEGFGDVVKDSSGKGRDGKITGATWVKADGSPIPAVPASTVPTSNGVVYLDDLPEKELKVFNFGKHGLDTSGKPVERRGRQPQHCLYMHPLTDAEPSTVTYSLNGRFEALNATVGLLDAPRKAETTLTFRVLGDGRELWKSPLIQKFTDEAVCSVSVASVRELRLEVICKGGTFNVNGAWIEPRLTPVASPVIPAEALTFGGHRYLLVDNFCTWSEAKAKAEALGGHLATVNSKEERDWILTNVFRKRPRAGEANDRGIQMRLGGLIAGPGSRWTWITGEPFDESLWLGSMPTVVEKCGLCWTADGTWNNSPTDSPNARSFYFLVEWDTPGAAGPQSVSGPPTADHALQFDGKTAHVTTPILHGANTPFTIEVTLRPGPVRGAIISNSEGSGLGLDIVNGAPNFLAFRRSSGAESYARATAPTTLDMSGPHRLAAVYDGAKIRLFVDGKLAATSDLAGEYLPSNLPFVIGASPEGQGIDYPFTGTLDEVRISKAARYTTDYNPVDRLPSDPDTLAMYHFDDGSGDVLKDSSGHSRHGKIVDAKWVNVEGASGPAAASAAPQSGVGQSLDLLPLVDLGQDILEGEWSKDGAGFVTRELKTNSWLRLPAELGEAYSLRAAFSTERGNVSFVLPFESKGLELCLSTNRVVACLKQLNDPTNPTAIVPKAINDGKRHEALIEVMQPSPSEVKLTVAIDGVPALQWQGSRTQLQSIDNRRLLAPTLSVGSFLPVSSPMKLLEAQLTTTQGVTKPLRATSTTAAAPAVGDPAAVAKWFLDNKKLARIGFEIGGRVQYLSTIPTGPYKVVELNFSRNNNAGQPLTEEELGRLAVFTDLETLEVGDQPLTDAGLVRLTTLKKLRKLTVPNTALTPAAVPSIRQFPQLEKLHAFSSDEWLKPLAGMTSLKSLVVHRSEISIEAMSWFPQYPNLNDLVLQDCFTAVGDKLNVALAPLKDCKNLSKLRLSTGLVDAGTVAVLSGLTQLRDLDLGTTQFTEAQVKQLAAALPRCKIIWTDAANKNHTFEPTAPPDQSR